jgi:ribosomal protein L12E/L44/L45/RPP1/RPP2
MNRTKGILAAGSLTGLVIITMLALGFSNIGAWGTGEAETAVIEPTPIVIQEPQPEQDASETVRAWQKYGRELESTVQTMQQRETQYQTQIDAANQTILQLQDQVNSANAASSIQVVAPANAPAPAPVSYEEYEEHEDEEHEEHEEHEDEEHEEHEEHDDDD